MEKALWYFDLVSPFANLHYHGLRRLRDRLGALGGAALTAAHTVKQQLIVNTQQAIGAGVFGVARASARDSS